MRYLVVLALLLPAVESAREEGKRMACMSQIRHLGLATFMYAADADSLFPHNNYTVMGPGRQIFEYFGGNLAAFICPSDRTHNDPTNWMFHHANSGGWQGPGHGRFADPRISYNYAKQLFGETIPWASSIPLTESIHLDDVNSPTICYMWLDATGDWSGIDVHDPPYDTFGGYGWESIHGGGDNFIFVDGHLESIDTRAVPPPQDFGPREYIGYTNDPDF